MFTDMVGYTALMQENEQLAIQKRDRNKKIFEDALAKYDGKLLMYYGDGTLSIFTSAVNAVKSAIEIQTLNLQDPKIDVRIGLHIGDVMFDDTGIYGDSVNIASRLETLAVPGAVFISEKLFEEIQNQQGIDAKPLGYFELKNVKQPMQVFAVSNPGIVVPSREDVKGKVKQTLNSLAVLPFASLSSDPENEFFCDGMTEELINVLSKVNGLQITSRTSAFAFKGKNEDVREIAGKLNVQKVIEGSVRKAGNKIRVTVQLINAADGYHFWSETYDRSLEDIFQIQDDVARAIANKMRENLNTEQHQSQLSKAPTDNLEAYKLYLKGIQLWDRADLLQQKLAMECFIEARKLDPKFAAPSAYLAVYYSFFAQTGHMSASEALRLANENAARAMSIDPENPTALAALAMLKLYQWEWNEGFELVKRALAFNGSDPMIHLIAAEYYLLFDDNEKEIDHAQKSYELDPLSANNLGQAARHFIFAGKIAEGLKMAEDAMTLDPQNLVSRNMHAYALALSGNPQRALDEVKATHKITGDFPLVLMSMGFIYCILGEKEKALEIISKIEGMMQANPEMHLDYAVAFVSLHAGDMKKFYIAFDRGIERHSLWLVQFYSTTMMKLVWYDEHVVASRKKLGLPVKEK